MAALVPDSAVMTRTVTEWAEYGFLIGIEQTRRETNRVRRIIEHVVALTIPTNVLLWIIRNDNTAESKRAAALIKPSWLPPRFAPKVNP